MIAALTLDIVPFGCRDTNAYLMETRRVPDVSDTLCHHITCHRHSHRVLRLQDVNGSVSVCLKSKDVVNYYAIERTHRWARREGRNRNRQHSVAPITCTYELALLILECVGPCNSHVSQHIHPPLRCVCRASDEIIYDDGWSGANREKGPAVVDPEKESQGKVENWARGHVIAASLHKDLPSFPRYLDSVISQ